MKSDLFKHEMTETSGIFGRRSDTEVVFEGTGAKTNGKKIFLPAIASGVDVKTGTVMVLRGYRDHEAFHVYDTDFEYLNRWARGKFKGVVRGKQKTLMSLQNCLEDVWIERRGMKRYPGSEKNLSATASKVNGTFFFRPDAKAICKNWLMITGVALTWEGRKGYADVQFCEECLSLLDPEHRARIEGWVQDVLKSESTRDNCKLAEKIYQELLDENEKRKREGDDDEESGDEDTQDTQEGDEGDGTEEKDDGTPEGTGGQDVGDDTQAGEQGDGGEAKSDGDTDGESEEKATDEGGDVGKEVFDDEGTPISGEFQNGVDDVVKEIENGISLYNIYKPYTTRFDQVNDRNSHTNTGSVLRNSLGKDNYNHVMKTLSGSANVMRRKIERALAAKMNRGFEFGKEDGRLDVKSLVRAYQGKPDVFREREPVAEINTAVVILIDCSGSMAGTPIKLAQQVAICIAEALERTTVKYSLRGFTTTSESEVMDLLERQLRSGQLGAKDIAKIARIDATNHIIFKAFDEPLSKAKGSLGSLTKVDRGCNADGEAILWSAQSLAERTENRKVLIVLSDGAPQFTDGKAALRSLPKYLLSSGRNSMTATDHLRASIDYVTGTGTECVGIGIMDDNVELFYPRYVVVNDLADLTKTALDQLAKVLLGDKFEIDNSVLLKAKKIA